MASMVQLLSEYSQYKGAAPLFHVRHDRLTHWVSLLTIIYVAIFSISADHRNCH